MPLEQRLQRIRFWLATHVGWPRPLSLSAMAQSRQALLGGPGRVSVLRRRSAERIRGVWSSPWSCAFLLPPLAGATFLPISVVVPPFSQRMRAEAFLSTLWQVEAAALALSAAVIIFAFDVLSNRSGTSLRTAVRSSGLIPLLFIGLSGLIVTGIALLGYGRGAPAGWPGTWAMSLGGLGLLLLFPLFARALREIDPEILRARRRKQGRREVQLEVHRIVHERIALSLLRTECDAVGVTFHQFGGARAIPGGWEKVEATRTGRVRDISRLHLADLPRLVRRYSAGDSPILLVAIGDRIIPRSTVVAIPPGASRLVRRVARGVVTI